MPMLLLTLTDVGRWRVVQHKGRLLLWACVTFLATAMLPPPTRVKTKTTATSLIFDRLVGPVMEQRERIGHWRAASQHLLPRCEVILNSTLPGLACKNLTTLCGRKDPYA